MSKMAAADPRRTIGTAEAYPKEGNKREHLLTLRRCPGLPSPPTGFIGLAASVGGFSSVWTVGHVVLHKVLESFVSEFPASSQNNNYWRSVGDTMTINLNLKRI